MSDPPQDHERRAWRTDAEWQRLATRIAASERSTPISWYRRPALVAAAAVLVISATYGVLRQSLSPTKPSALASRTVEHVETTTPGQRRSITLPDSTRVTIGPATTIRYRLTSSSREVVLQGLAQFTVRHDSARPFVVRTGAARATDIGTAFTVKAYPADSTVQVSVTEGVVAFAGDSVTPAIRLAAGTSARTQRDGVVRIDPTHDTADDAAWVDGRLFFRNATLDDVAKELGRWFDVDIRISERALGQRRVTALYAAPTLDGVLDALSATSNARYERQGRAITLAPRGR